jgi:sialate O-acetylesterase
MDVWVLAGQSNMHGLGLLEGASTPDDRVWCFSSAGKWVVAEEPLHRLWESYTPVNQWAMRGNLPPESRDLSDAELAQQDNQTRQAGAGLGLEFGKSMAEATGRPVGLIPAAHPATALERWNPATKKDGVHSFYGAMLDRIERSGGKVQGVLWFQGEGDAVMPAETFLSYEQRLMEWLTALRQDLGHPELPVLMVQLGRLLKLGRYVIDATPEMERGWDVVRAAFTELSSRVPGVAATTAIDVGLVDTIHIDTPGLQRLGRRLARLARQIQQLPHEQAGPHVVRMEGRPAHGGLTAVSVICRGVEGGWLPRTHMSGFECRTPDGKPHPDTCVVDVSADTVDPRNIRVLLGGGSLEDTRLGYGLGLSPYCNVVDEADMPLCAFLPRPIHIRS